MITTQEQYAAAVAQARNAAQAYYTAGTSPLDDDAYDRLVGDIAVYEQAHPGPVLPTSPTGKVAGGSVVGDVPHTVPMLSLDNVFGAEQLADWAASLERRLGHAVTAWSVEPKLDGLAISARYHHGRLVQLITRGDGTAGEDVSHAIGTIVGLPTWLAHPNTVELRGEVMMTIAQFEDACTKRQAHDGTTFANPRSAAAGTLRAQDRPYVCELTFFCYGALPQPDDTSDFAVRLREIPHSSVMYWVADQGAQTTAATPVAGIVAHTVEQVQQRVDEIAAARADLPIGIDGVVIKCDLAEDQAAAGFSSRAPRWAIAYKLPAIERITQLKNVTWAVGRTGVIAPRAELEPVEIDGVVVTFATLHNAADIARRDLRIGDHVTVVRAGDVIPRILAPVAHLRTGRETPVAFPLHCPNCGSDIDTSQQRWRCVRGRQCRLAPSIEYAVGRDQLDIEGIGGKLVTQLVGRELVTDIADLFTLTAHQLLGLDRMGTASVTKLLAAIQTAKTRPLSRVLCALGVQGTGRSMSRRIARHFGTMQALQAADVAVLQQVEGIGAEKAPLIVAELAELVPVIAKLEAAGVNLTEPGSAAEPGTLAAESPDAGQAPLAGMTVVVSGTMTGPLAAYSRNQMNELVEMAAGRSSSSVSAKTSLVVAGDGAGSKRAKALELGIPIISPEEFAERLHALLERNQATA
ncbi:NAD-dependent DNA ligase LigA [Sphaerisporangium flaviroseum]|uniref:DNA ligase n=1 Tax=Sphaerisporangium flaviroseum TaxID=509199 RepID=A0ABP7J1V8_9ACTN